MKRFNKLLCFMLVFVAVMAALCTVSFADNSNKWIEKAPMLNIMDEIVTTTLNGKIYLVGGSIQNTAAPTNKLQEYDPVTNTWSTKLPMTTARRGHMVITLNNKIYAIGGNVGGNTITNTVEEYDPTTNKWVTKAAMSKARAYFQAAVVNGKIYVLGGAVSGTTNKINTVEEYDPATNTWTTKASMLIARSNFHVAVVNGKIYALDGLSNENTYLNSTEEYDPATNTWTTKASMKAYKANSSVAVLNDKIYNLGWSNDGSSTNSVEEYDPATNKWLTKAPLTFVRFFNEIAVVGGKLYSIGGAVASGDANILYVYDPSTNLWTKLATMNVSRSVHHKVEVISDRIYAIGGNNTNSLEEYSGAITKPSNPQNLLATPGNSKIDLSWDTVDGATSYNVKRSETPGGPYQTIATTTAGAITYSDTGLQNGTTYYYVVSAVNAGGESSDSNEVSATPTAPQPTNQLKLVLEVNQEKQLSVSKELSDNTEMDWISSEPSIATVDSNGKVKALKPGNTVITCTSKDKSYTESINVLVVDLEYQLAVDLSIGDTCRLTIDDLTNTTYVTWTSYDSSIATVSAKGKVTAVGEGLTYITAADKDGTEIGRIYIRVRQ